MANNQSKLAALRGSIVWLIRMQKENILDAHTMQNTRAGPDVGPHSFSELGSAVTQLIPAEELSWWLLGELSAYSSGRR